MFSAFSTLAPVAAAVAALSSPTTLPDAAQVDTVERSLGHELAWPSAAGEPADFDRHYFVEQHDPTVLRAQFRRAAQRGKGKVFLDRDYRGFVFDGGCGVVNLTFFGAGDSRNRLVCGGR